MHPRILAAQSLPMLGYFQEPLLHIMDEIQQGLRSVLAQNLQCMRCLCCSLSHQDNETPITYAQRKLMLRLMLLS